MLYTDEAIRKRKAKEIAIKNKISIVIYIILIPLLIYNLYLSIKSIINPNETPSFLGIKTYVIVSGSMQPQLDIGDIVIVKKVKESDLKIGDIISFRHGQSVITHRIVNINETSMEKVYITKGDNNNTEDVTNVSFDSIEGKVVNKMPKIGYIYVLAKEKKIIILIILCIYGYAIHSYNKKIKKSERTRKRIEYETSNPSK